jgi:hypothetical protein
MHAVSPQQPREIILGLVELLKPLENFNARHADGREVGLFLGEVIHRSAAEEHAALTKCSLADAPGNYLSEVESLARDHAGLLARAGLELRVDEGIGHAKEILHDYGIVHEAFGSDLSTITVHIAELAVHDFAQFATFLDSLQGLRPSFVPTPEASTLFTRIADTLTASLERFDLRRKLGYSDDHAHATIEGAHEIVDRLHALQLTAVASNLSDIVYHAVTEDLSDYLRAKRCNLLPNDRKGPQSWHRELSAQQFEERWNVALTVCRDLTAGNSFALCSRVGEHLHTVAKGAFREIKHELATAKPDPHLREHGNHMLRVLAKTLDQIPITDLHSSRPV